MKVVIAIDSFKGSLDSVTAGRAAAEGVRRACPDAVCTVRPLADGGEGTVDALVAGMGGERQSVTVTGPAGKPVEADYGLLPGGVAVMEMAAAAGITLVSGEEKNPLLTTTYGVGEMILDAVQKGARKFIVGIGGSATNDGGAGMLQALGFRLLDADGRDIPRGGAGLAKLAKIEPSAKIELSAQSNNRTIEQFSFRIACDVTNPLCGPNGASAVFGPQKGATPEMVKELDAALAHFAEAVDFQPPNPQSIGLEDLRLKTQDLGPLANHNQQPPTPQPPNPQSPTISRIAGAGAAGGLGFAFKAFLGAELVPGVDLILRETKLEDYVKDADLVITGEGRLDGQTVMGKAPIGVARLAKKFGKPVFAFSGCVGDGVEAVNGAGIDAYFPILRKIVTLDEALDVTTAAANLASAVEQAVRIFRL